MTIINRHGLKYKIKTVYVLNDVYLEALKYLKAKNKQIEHTVAFTDIVNNALREYLKNLY